MPRKPRELQEDYCHHIIIQLPNSLHQMITFFMILITQRKAALRIMSHVFFNRKQDLMVWSGLILQIFHHLPHKAAKIPSETAFLKSRFT